MSISSYSRAHLAIFSIFSSMEESTNQTPQEDKATITLSSPLSSPTHEFSFTITLHPTPNSSPKHNKKNDITNSPSFALDLAPADDIFFQGHLLPLQLISRHSDNRSSVDDLTRPVVNISSTPDEDDNKNYGKRNKPKSFTSLFAFAKWLKPGDAEEDHNKRRKKTFDFSRFWKKYTRFMEPLFSSESAKRRRDLLKRPYSFSGNSNTKENGYWMRRRGKFSAPASRWTSPSNSGLLSVMPTGFSSSDDSSMEALQSAIQAAIAHCKNSTEVREIDA